MKFLPLLFILLSCNIFNFSQQNTSNTIVEKKSFKQTAKPNIDNEFAMEHERVLKSWMTDLDSIQDLGFKYKATFRIVDYINHYPTLPLEIKNEALTKIKSNYVLFEKMQNYLANFSRTDINYIFQENELSLLKRVGSLPFHHLKNNLCQFEQLMPILKDKAYLSSIYKSWSDVQNFLKAHDEFYVHNYFSSIKTLLKTNKILTELNAKEFEAMLKSYLSLYFGSPEEELKEKTKKMIQQRADALAKKGLDINPASYNKVIVACAWGDVQYVRNLFAQVITWYRMQWIAGKIKARLTSNSNLLKKLDSPQDLIRYLKLDNKNIIQESNLDGWRNDFKLKLIGNEIELQSSGANLDQAGDDLIFRMTL